MKKIVIIPARGGSKRIPRKNIKSFFGKPIVSYSLESSKESGIFDQIHLSTEDKEIFDIASSLGFKPTFYRSSECSEDHVPVKEVLKETVQEFEKLGENFDIICLLSATAPLITGKDLKAAYQEFEESDFRYPLLAVAQYPSPIQRALKFDSENNALEPLDMKSFLRGTHGLEESYYDVGSFAFFTKTQLFARSDKIKFIPYVLPFAKSVDVDNLEDWVSLEGLYLLQNNCREPKEK